MAAVNTVLFMTSGGAVRPIGMPSGLATQAGPMQVLPIQQIDRRRLHAPRRLAASHTAIDAHQRRHMDRQDEPHLSVSQQIRLRNHWRVINTVDGREASPRCGKHLLAVMVLAS